MTYNYNLVRKVLIRERELKTLKHHCLVKSPHGNRNLYDTVDWRPITSQDILLEMIKGEPMNNIRDYVRKHVNSMYDKRYYYWDFSVIDDVIMIRPDSGGKTYYEPFGWAVLAKNFNK